MIRVASRVRHKEEALNKEYGVMEVLSIKGDFATCRYGDFHNINVVTIDLGDLILEQ